MDQNDFYTTSEAARVLGISRIAVFQKIREGKIKAEKYGRNYLIPRKDIMEIAGQVISQKRKDQIDEGMDKTIADYGDVLRKLGQE